MYISNKVYVHFSIKFKVQLIKQFYKVRGFVIFVFGLREFVKILYLKILLDHFNIPGLKDYPKNINVS